MKLGIFNREAIREISPTLEDELDLILSAISATFMIEHDWRGRHTNINAISISGVPATQEQVAESEAIQQSVENEGNIEILRAGGNSAQSGGTAAGGAGGDVVGPSSSANGRIAMFGGTTGKLLADSGYTVATALAAAGDVVGPSSSANGRIAIFNGTTGKLLADAGYTVATAIAAAGDVDGPVSSTDLRIAVFDGTTGKLLADGGIGVAGLGRIASASLTELELEALGTTAITVIAAPGADKVICPVRFDVQLVVTTGYTSSPTFKLVHEGDATALTGLANPVWTGVDTLFSSQVAAAVNRTISGFDPRNKALQIQASADPTGTGVATAKVRVLYYVADVS